MTAPNFVDTGPPRGCAWPKAETSGQGGVSSLDERPESSVNLVSDKGKRQFGPSYREALIASLAVELSPLFDALKRDVPLAGQRRLLTYALCAMALSVHRRNRVRRRKRRTA